MMEGVRWRERDRTRVWRNRVHNYRKKDVRVEDQEDIDRGGYKQRGGWCDGGSKMEKERWNERPQE